MKKILFLLLLVSTSSAFACSCYWGGNFLKSQKHARFIFKARVVKKLYHNSGGQTFDNQTDYLSSLIEYPNDGFRKGESLQIEILEKINGWEKRRLVEVYGSDGVDCRESLSNFEVGKTYILSLYKSSNESGFNQYNEDAKDYSIGGCSETWLSFDEEKQTVTGKIFGKKRKAENTIPYKRFKKELTKEKFFWFL